MKWQILSYGGYSFISSSCRIRVSLLRTPAVWAMIAVASASYCTSRRRKLEPQTITQYNFMVFAWKELCGEIAEIVSLIKKEFPEFYGFIVFQRDPIFCDARINRPWYPLYIKKKNTHSINKTKKKRMSNIFNHRWIEKFKRPIKISLLMR